ASSLAQEFHGYQWAALDPGLQVAIATEFLMNRGDDLAASGLIHNGSRSGGQVSAYALLEVEGEFGVRQQVGISVASARGPRDVQASCNIVQPDLFTAGLPGLPASGGDIEGAVAFPSLFDRLVHNASPMVVQSAQRARPSPCRMSLHAFFKMPATT